jgi:hypothetical protein
MGDVDRHASRYLGPSYFFLAIVTSSFGPALPASLHYFLLSSFASVDGLHPAIHITLSSQIIPSTHAPWFFKMFDTFLEKAPSDDSHELALYSQLLA